MAEKKSSIKKTERARFTNQKQKKTSVGGSRNSRRTDKERRKFPLGDRGQGRP